MAYLSLLHFLIPHHQNQWLFLKKIDFANMLTFLLNEQVFQKISQIAQTHHHKNPVIRIHHISWMHNQSLLNLMIPVKI